MPGAEFAAVPRPSTSGFDQRVAAWNESRAALKLANSPAPFCRTATPCSRTQHLRHRGLRPRPKKNPRRPRAVLKRTRMGSTTRRPRINASRWTTRPREISRAKPSPRAKREAAVTSRGARPSSCRPRRPPPTAPLPPPVLLPPGGAQRRIPVRPRRRSRREPRAALASTSFTARTGRSARHSGCQPPASPSEGRRARPPPERARLSRPRAPRATTMRAILARKETPRSPRGAKRNERRDGGWLRRAARRMTRGPRRE